jgi:hypothetical protein
MNSASPRDPSAARCPIQKNAGVTSMESLRYKEFCCPHEIARFELPLSEVAGRFAELLFQLPDGLMASSPRCA